MVAIVVACVLCILLAPAALAATPDNAGPPKDISIEPGEGGAAFEKFGTLPPIALTGLPKPPSSICNPAAGGCVYPGN
jgi:hypothetical protein